MYRDATVYYAPPSLERVKMVRAGGPESRSIDDDIFNGFPRPKGPIVIPAAPKKKNGVAGYSVYGSPDINYSALYTQPPVQLPTHEEPWPEGRDAPYLAFQRDYLSSAVNSRSADTEEYPFADYSGSGSGNGKSSAFQRLDVNDRLQMIKPKPKPRKKATEYFFYSDDSEFYKERLAANPDLNENSEENNEIISIDGIVIEEPLPKKYGPKAARKHPEDLQTSPSKRNPQYYQRPQPPSKPANAIVYNFKNPYGMREQVGVIYEETNSPGPQISKVFQSNKNDVLNSARHGDNSINIPAPSIPLNQHPYNFERPPGHQYHQQPQQHYAQARRDDGRNRNYANPGQRSPGNFIPLQQREKSKSSIFNLGKIFPLGNPFQNPLLKARPEFFKPLSYPPLYKTQPQKLEGSFGPPLPPAPEPDKIYFADENFDSGYGSSQPTERTVPVRRQPYQENWQRYPDDPRQGPQAAQEIQQPQEQQQQQHHVYKTVRDMDYARPGVILSVKSSGELYKPNPEHEGKPMEDPSPRSPILPGGLTPEQWQERHEAQAQAQAQEHTQNVPEPIQEVPEIPVLNDRQDSLESITSQEESQDPADDRAWLPDFSDAIHQGQTSPNSFSTAAPSQAPPLPPPGPPPQSPSHIPTLSEFFGSFNRPSRQKHQQQPLDLDTGSSITQQVVFREPVKHKKTGFLFPGKSTSDPVRRPDREVSNKPSSVKVQKVEPNYSTVIGLTYDDDASDVQTSGEEFQDVTADQHDDDEDDENGNSEYKYNKEELYEICIKEVPKYLHKELCGYINEETAISQATKIQPRPAKLLYEVAPAPALDKDPFAGIPMEIAYEIDKPKDGGPLVISNNPRVKIYKPHEKTPEVITAKPAPSTTTTTTPIPFVPEDPEIAQPAFVPHHPVPPPPPPASPANSIPAPPRKIRKRPLLFNKRNPATGESVLSRPFEYFNRLTQFFNNRVNAPGGGHSPTRPRQPPPPRLIRHRTNTNHHQNH